MDEPIAATAERLLAGAELWQRSTDDSSSGGPSSLTPPGDAAPGARGPAFEPGDPVLIAGWEDGHAFCQVVCTTDVGLAFCRRCPTRVARRALRTGRGAGGRCPAGVRLLAFPAPAGSRDQVALLRVAPPSPREAEAVSATVRVAPATLRRAARDTPAAPGLAALHAARLLRNPLAATRWQVDQRNRGADRRRTAAAALAQMIATSEEFHELYRASERQRVELERNRRSLDRLARETLRATDEERARVAHLIHDTAAQSMVSSYRFLDAARVAASALEGPVAAHLGEASDRLVAAIREVRAVLNRLLPPGLEELGLGEALRIRVQDLTAGTAIVGEVTGDLPRFEAWVEQALYGMASEALSNAVRHGAPRHVEVALRRERGRAIILVTDDGAGFDAGAEARRRSDHGLGLLGMGRQARWLGGRLEVTSRPDQGTRVRISVPLERHRAREERAGAGHAGQVREASDGGAVRRPAARRTGRRTEGRDPVPAGRNTGERA